MAAPTPGLDDIVRLDRAHVIHPITEFRKHERAGAQIFVGGRGVELELADGRRLIDGFSGLFNINVGHGRTEIADAVAAQMRRLACYRGFWDFGNEPAARLASCRDPRPRRSPPRRGSRSWSPSGSSSCSPCSPVIVAASCTST